MVGLGLFHVNFRMDAISIKETWCDFDRKCIKSIDKLWGKADIFSVLNLLTHEHGISILLFRSSWILFISTAIFSTQIHVLLDLYLRVSFSLDQL